MRAREVGTPEWTSGTQRGCMGSGRQRAHKGGLRGSGLLLAEVLETEPQLVMMPEEFGVFWDLCQKYLGHLQGALQGGRGS